MWENLSSPWQRSFELAWESYKNNTIPIGAVITDARGNIISEGRNRIYDEDSNNPLAGTAMAHAEMTAMMVLKVKEHLEIKSYTLYTTMEPCPMCFGTMLMMGIRDLKYAARDNYAGATCLKDKMDYINNKKVKIQQGKKALEWFQIILQSSFECIRKHSKLEELLDSWRVVNKEAVDFAKILYEEEYFLRAIVDDIELGEVYDEVIERFSEYRRITTQALIV